jgi:hypothetical protein
MLQNFYHSLYFPDSETGETFACDAIIANPPSFAAPHLAEAFGLPLMLSFSTYRDMDRIEVYSPSLSHGMVAHSTMGSSACQHQANERISATQQLSVLRPCRIDDMARAGVCREQVSNEDPGDPPISKPGRGRIGGQTQDSIHVLLVSERYS